MSETIRILAGTVRPGGATCLFPVINELRRQVNVDVRLIAHSHAAAVLTEYGVNFVDPSEDGARLFTEEIAQEIASAYQPDMILTGVFGPVEGGLDFWLLRAAQRMQIPSYGVLDAWMNYAMRFADPSTGAPSAYLPDRMAVMDEQTVTELAKVCIPRDRLDVAGHPFLPVVRCCSAGTSARRSLREQFNAAEGDNVILFLSEPLRWGEEQGLNESLGYDEHDAFALLVSALESLDQPGVLIVKEHPRHASLELPDRIGKTRVIGYDTNAFLDLIVAADVVAGMSTTLLVYAFLLGKQVVAVQPGVRPEYNYNVLTRRGIIPNCDTVEAITEALGGSSTGPDHTLARARETMKWQDDTAARTADYILKFIGRCRDKQSKYDNRGCAAGVSAGA